MYQIELKTIKELEEIEPMNKAKIAHLQADLDSLERIIPEKLTEREKDKLVSKKAKIDRLKAIEKEIENKLKKVK